MSEEIGVLSDKINKSSSTKKQRVYEPPLRKTEVEETRLLGDQIRLYRTAIELCDRYMANALTPEEQDDPLFEERKAFALQICKTYKPTIKINPKIIEKVLELGEELTMDALHTYRRARQLIEQGEVDWDTELREYNKRIKARKSKIEVA